MHYHRILPFMFLFSFLFSCLEKEEYGEVNLVISFPQAADKEFFLQDWYYNWQEPTALIRLDNNGKTSSTIKIKKGYYLLADAETGSQLALLYLEPNKKEEVKFTGNKITFSGDLAKENTFINDYRKNVTSLFKDFQAYFNIDKNEFQEVVKGIEEDILKSHKESSKGVNKKIAAIEKENALENLNLLKLEYIVFHNEKPEQIEQEMEAYGLTERKYDEKKFQHSDAYRDYLLNYFLIQIRPRIENDKIKPTDQKSFSQYFIELPTNLPPDIKDYILFSMIRRYDAGFAADKIISQQNNISNSFQSDYYKKEFQKILNELQGIAKGKKAPAINAVSPIGKKFSWDNYKGKPVLADIWASWCTPCLQQIPAMEELTKKYGDKITIVGLSVDNIEAQWHAALIKFKLNQNQYYINGKEAQEKFSTDYSVVTIPHYILIDKDGKIIDGKIGYIKDLDHNQMNENLIQEINELITN